MNLITDLFTYFSKFVTKEAVLANFGHSSGSDYETLKSQFDSHASVMSIPDYVFGHDKNYLLKRVGMVKEYFLFVEYSQINNSGSTANKHEVLITVMVGKKVDASTMDGMGTAIIMDTCLEQLNLIGAQIKQDKKDKLHRIIIDSSTLYPIDTFDIPGIVGWSMECKQEIPALWD